MKISELVTQTLATGLPPLDLSYRAVRSCFSYNPIAYCTEIAVNSVEMGRLMQSEFSSVTDDREIGLRLCDWSIAQALRNIEQFRKAGRNPRWIAIRCPDAYIELPDLSDRVKKLTAKYDPKGIKLCLAFSDRLLFSDADIRKAILDLKLLDVQTMLLLSEKGDCPLFKLVDLPVDHVLLAQEMTAMVHDRNKPAVLPALVEYLHSLQMEVVANVAQASEHYHQLARLECEGYLSGQESRLSVEEAVLQKGDND